MVTEEERDLMWRSYAPDRRARLNLGIRRRLAPLLENDRRRIELLFSLLLSLPGTPVLYYGDEIGMGDNIELEDRDGVRTPMQWSAAPNAGFSSADVARLCCPVIDDNIYGYRRVNVEAQRADLGSPLNRMREMIRKVTNAVMLDRQLDECDLTFADLEKIHPRWTFEKKLEDWGITEIRPGQK